MRHNFDRSDMYTSGAPVQDGAGYKDNIMIYPSGLLMGKIIHLQKRDNEKYDELKYTKHYYIGSERVAARSGSLQQMGFFPASQIAAAMPKLANGHSFPTAQGGQLKTSIIQTNTTTSQTDANTYVLEKVFDKFGVQQPVFANKTTPQMTPTPGHTVANPAILTYYFHSDHLGSSSYMSSARGKILQHLEYLPFGEAMMDEHINSRNSPFKYNGKHLDEETNNYFYGARYYDPKLSNFISVDPLAEETMSSYGYCYNNPIIMIDPDGRAPFTEIYNTSGTKIGTDGINNNKKMVIADNSEAKQIGKIKGNVDLSNVKSGVLLPSNAALKETINVLDRQENNGGYKEESSLVMKDGTVLRGKTGPDPTISSNIQTATSTLPNIPAGKTTADVEASIHSHPIGVQKENNNAYPQSASIPSAQDKQTFSQYETNIIVGPIGTGRVTTNAQGVSKVPNRPNGAVFYNSSGQETLSLKKSALENIIKE